MYLPSFIIPHPITVAFLPTICNPVVSKVVVLPSPYADVPNPVSPNGGKQRGLINFVKATSLSSLTRPMSLFKIVGSLKSIDRAKFEIQILFE